jgi:hypothetical protein
MAFPYFIIPVFTQHCVQTISIDAKLKTGRKGQKQS